MCKCDWRPHAINTASTGKSLLENTLGKDHILPQLQQTGITVSPSKKLLFELLIEAAQTCVTAAMFFHITI